MASPQGYHPAGSPPAFGFELVSDHRLEYIRQRCREHVAGSADPGIRAAARLTLAAIAAEQRRRAGTAVAR